MSEKGLAAIAKRQFGVFSRGQAIEQKISVSAIGRRLVSNDWERLYPAVYRVRGCPSFGQQPLIAAWLAAGPTAVVSHVSAARLWRLDGLDRQPSAVELSMPPTVRIHLAGVRIHRVKGLERCSMLLEGFRVTTLPRTLIDLSGRLTLKKLEMALDSATRRTFEVLPEIEAGIEALGTVGRKGCGALYDLVMRKQGRAGTDSPLETTALQRLRDHRFPQPETQWPVFGDDEVPFAHLDLSYPAYKIAIVCNGLRAHGNRIRFDLDARQHARLAGLGWHVIPVTAGTVETDGWLSDIARLLPPGSITPELRQAELW